MILGLDYYNNMKVPSLVLCKPNGDRIDTIPCTEKKGTIKFNDYDEISFTTYLYIDGKKNEIYDKVNELMHIELPEIGRYVITEVDINSEGTNFESKSCVALSEEVLLAKRYLELFYINRASVGSVEQDGVTDDTPIQDIKNVKFYQPNDQERSLLHLVLNEKCPGWKIGYVDNELCELERNYEIDRQDIYSFLTQDVAKATECIFEFDTLHHRVNVYAEKTVGEDTDIHISYGNLTKTVDISSSTDDIKTCLTVKGRDDLNIREVNMGVDRIYNLDYFHSTEYMSQGLYDAYAAWKKKWEEYAPRYEYLIGGRLNSECFFDRESAEQKECNIWDSRDKNVWIYYNEDVEGVKLIDEEIPTNPQNYAWGYQRIFDKIHYLTNTMMPSDLSGDYDFDGDGKTEHYDNLEEEIEKRLIKLTESGSDENKAFEAYMDIFSQYGLVPLEGKLDVYFNKRTVNMEYHDGDIALDDPLHGKLLNISAGIRAIQTQINSRKAQIEHWKLKQTDIKKQMDDLCNDLEMTNEKNFTREQYVELQYFIREDELSSDNFLTNSIDTDVKRIDTIRDLLKYGQEELAKVAVPTLSFSMDMANIYAIPEFQEKVDKFKEGNYIYVSLRDDFYLKVRLLVININFLDSSDFSVEFGNVSKTRGNKLLQDVTEALSLASSAATSVSFNASNWNEANKESSEIGDMINDGLLNAGKSLRTVESDVVIDKYGITIKNNPKKNDDGTQMYPGDEIFLGGGRILFTSDNFRSVKSALGRVKYTKNFYDSYTGKWETENRDVFGLIAETVLAGYIAGTTIEASTMIGGELISPGYKHNDITEEYNGTRIDLKEGTFEFNGANKKRLTLEKIYDEHDKTKVKDYLLTVHGRIEAEHGYIGKEGNKGFTIGTNGDEGYGYISSGGKLGLNHTNKDGGIYIGADGISLGVTTEKKVDGKTVYDTPFQVTSDGFLTAKSGEIGGFTLSDKAIYKGKETLTSTTTDGIGIYIGEEGIALGNSFRVTKDGFLTSTAGEIGGATIANGAIYALKPTKTRSILPPAPTKDNSYWVINSNGSAIFNNVYINGVQSGSNFGGTNGIYFNGEGVFGNFANGFSVGSSFTIIDDRAKKDFDDLVVGILHADEIYSKFVSSDEIESIINKSFMSGISVLACTNSFYYQGKAIMIDADGVLRVDPNHSVT